MKELCGKKGLNVKQTVKGTSLLAVQRIVFPLVSPQSVSFSIKAIHFTIDPQTCQPSVKQKSICMGPGHILPNAWSHLSVIQTVPVMLSYHTISLKE